MWSSTLDVYGNGQTVAVCNGHDFRTLAALCFANLGAPFLAGAKLPSIKASRTSKTPLALRSKARASRTLFILQIEPIVETYDGRFGRKDSGLEHLPTAHRCARSTKSRSARPVDPSMGGLGHLYEVSVAELNRRGFPIGHWSGLGSFLGIIFREVNIRPFSLIVSSRIAIRMRPRCTPTEAAPRLAENKISTSGELSSESAPRRIQRGPRSHPESQNAPIHVQRPTVPCCDRRARGRRGRSS